VQQDTYNGSDGQLATYTDSAAGGLSQETGTTPATVDDERYSYDNTGQVTSEADTLAGGSAQVQCFDYDYLGRLTTAWSQGSAGCSSGPSQSAAAPYWGQYAYNTVNDMTSETSTPASGSATTTTDDYPAAESAQPHALLTQTANGATTTHGYDSAGQLTSESGASSESLTWDDTGKLASLTSGSGTTNYLYDASGNLLLRADPSGTTLYLADEEITLSSAGTLSGVRYYSIGGHQIAVRSSSGSVDYLTGDQEGTQTLAIDSGTLAVSRRFYFIGLGCVGHALASAATVVADVTGITNTLNCIENPSWGQCLQAAAKIGMDVLAVATDGASEAAEASIEAAADAGADVAADAGADAAGAGARQPLHDIDYYRDPANLGPAWDPYAGWPAKQMNAGTIERADIHEYGDPIEGMHAIIEWLGHMLAG